MRKAPLTVCVAGGGFTGAAAGLACLSRIEQPFRLIVVEPSASLGRGVAYGAHHPLHLLNVRTRDLSVRAGQPGDFLNWAFRQLDQGENHAGLHEGLAHTFLPRQLFGEYVRQRFFEAREARRDVDYRLINGTATAARREGEAFRVEVKGSEPVIADVLLLATAYGLPKSAQGGALAPYQMPPGEKLAHAKTLALIGSGLTMVDVLLSARRDGFQGQALVFSPRGQLPRPHAARGVVPQEIGLPRSKRVSALTAGVVLACAAAEAHGTPWQAIVNGLRPSLQDLWRGLPVQEQSRFLRHVRPLWDAHRHRLPIEVHARLMAEFREGGAMLVRGRVSDVALDDNAFVLTVRRRGTTEPEHMRADLAYDCTGYRPDVASPLVASLLDRGLATTDPHRLGLAVERNGEVVGKSGRVTEGLFALGPLGKGSLWEITAVPEIVVQCDAAARSIAGHMGATGRHHAMTASC